ncbi:vWA domain-containing protein [Hyperthermus butylicus]|uniref:Conserved archaeal protein n=1 Tax=Hyperthermus butylicus (strain DSM 5456 / JCM 9403 / PLM1-5) TaxID=415426 RepID=A2BM85_HYPBU|nr:VWA domain-containing protein [Hyperthermus butylicus]ABM81096.1 conserved archaeal protein [Hyperthermus butylicus DSM 5456]
MSFIRGINYEDPPIRYRGERIIGLLKKLAPEAFNSETVSKYLDVDLAISVYYMLFLPFPVLQMPDARDEKQTIQYLVLSSMLEAPQLRDVRRHTIADSTTSMVASAIFLEALLKELNKLPRPQGGETRSKSAADAEQGLNAENIRESVRKALETARDVAQQAKELTNLAMRFTAGNASMLSLDDVIQDVINLARNTDVKVLLEALKTIESTEAYIRTRKIRSPRGELDGYELGSDIERVVASELALPTDLFLLKFAERNLLLYKKVVSEEYGKFYVLLDKSGSMMGMKIIWAKAVALALAQRAIREKREFYIRFFDSIPYPPLYIPKRVHGRDVVKLLEYVARIRANGGTDITRAILTAVDDIATKLQRSKVSDIILITDGEDKIAIDTIRRSLNKVNARLHTVMISGNNPDLRAISDSYMVATKLDREEALRVIMLGS